MADRDAFPSGIANAIINQRFFLGVYAPIVLEFIVYVIYISTKGELLNWGIILWTLMLIAPALFFYMVSPMFIYFVSGIGKIYEKSLTKNIDSLFIFSDDEAVLKEDQKTKIRSAINKKLIPQLVKKSKVLYIDSFINRSRNNSKDSLLSSFETLFLFSSVWSILSLFNFIGVVILHYRTIDLKFVIIDTISDPKIVAFFATLFIILAFLSELLAFYSIKRLRKLMIETLPIVVPIDEEELIQRNNYIRALSQFPIENYINEKMLVKHAKRFDAIYQQEFAEPLSEALRVYANNQVAKQQAWRIYKPILDTLEITPSQTATIKSKFFESPFYEIARGVFSYEHEVNSMKTDIEYVKNRLTFWNKISEEEKATAAVFLFRSTEQLLKSLIERLNAPMEIYANFSMILQFLKEKGLILDKEEAAFDNIRKKRNTLVHQSGRVVTIQKKEIELFLESLENILLKAEEKLKK